MNALTRFDLVSFLVLGVVFCLLLGGFLLMLLDDWMAKRCTTNSQHPWYRRWWWAIRWSFLDRRRHAARYPWRRPAWWVRWSRSRASRRWDDTEFAAGRVKRYDAGFAPTKSAAFSLPPSRHATAKDALMFRKAHVSTGTGQRLLNDVYPTLTFEEEDRE